MNNFYHILLNEVIQSLENNFEDNHDFYRFGSEKNGLFSRNTFKKLISNWNVNLINPHYIINSYDSVKDYMEEFNRFYELLEDEKSKELLVKLVAYRILGKTKVKLPLNTPSFWKNLAEIEALENQNDYLQIDFLNWKLKKTNLSKINFSIELYYITLGIHCTFMLEQYRYVDSDDKTIVRAEKGDNVLDLGGCWGDTALYFASLVGDEGKVFSYEFIPSNLEIFRKNLSLNPDLSKIVQIVERAAWSESDKDLFYIDNGPASRVSLNKSNTQNDYVSTLSIDNLVQNYNIERVDFIKMDIEGAERKALAGAVKTIEKFKPKLPGIFK